MTDYDVLVVGAGPVGLVLAVELGQRGVKCLIVEKNATHSILPKMERCHPRTMEHFRRLGIADEVRALGYPLDAPFDAYLVETLVGPAIARMERPSVNKAREAFRARTDGSAPAEPYQIVSQYAIEPFLREVAERTLGVTVQFACTYLGHEEHDDYVTVRLKDDSGGRFVKARYLVGCDGGASAVRAALGFKLEGEPNVRAMTMGQFLCEGLFDRIPVGKGCHYFRTDDRWSFLIIQGDIQQVTLHAQIDDENKLPKLLEEFVGFSFDYKTLYLGKWMMRLMIGDRYSTRRVFLAGDAVHLVPPIGGLGMNTGIGDAIDLAWKLAASVVGWGGEELLASYEAERRAIGKRSVAAAARAHAIQTGWRDRCAELVKAGWNGNDDETKKEFGEHWLQEHGRGSFRLTGISQGYRYLGSPIVAYEDGDDGGDQASYEYIPTTLAGARIPHLWLKDGAALQDKVGAGFTLITCRPASQEIESLADAFAKINAPFDAVDVTDEPLARKVYQKDLILLRPDLHVAWRGDHLPGSPEELVRHVAGWAA